jgi:hypothetical protein
MKSGVWFKPLLIVLCRARGGESLLEYCKTKSVSDPGVEYVRCELWKDPDKPKCQFRDCQQVADS